MDEGTVFQKYKAQQFPFQNETNLQEVLVPHQNKQLELTDHLG